MLNNRIIIFVFISMALHLTLLGTVTFSPDVKIRQEQGSSALQLKLVKTQQYKAKDRLSTQPTQVAEKKPQPDKIISQPDPASRTIQQPLEMDTPSIASPPAESSSKQPAENRVIQPDYEKVSQLLSKQLSQYFYYPKTAQRRHWQGQVILTFTILSDGNIQQLRIDKSSGYDILDRAAIDALSKIQDHERFALALNGHDIEQILPITYQLVSR